MCVKLDEILHGIQPSNKVWRLKAKEYLNHLAIPPGSLGELLTLAEQLSAIKETLKPSVRNKMVIVMAGDHGVVEEGVSAFPQEVTPQMVSNFVKGGASINVLSEVVGAKVVVVDMGVAEDLTVFIETGDVLPYKIDYGTKNMTKGPAMTRDQAEKALLAGIEVVSKMIQEKGVELIATGDMGIGNTTPSSAIVSVMTGKSVTEVTGRGTGIDDQALENKIRAIEKAIEINKPDAKDSLDVLSKVGGYEIAGIAGVILGAAYYKVPVVIDGFISTAGALIAKGLNANVVDYMIASHKSVEVGHQHMWQELGLDPILDLKFRLGEGTGAVMAMNIVEAAAQVINKVLTFEDAGVSKDA
ncbi:nicotinate-nucleotide-dimethylbenzimidazole phosphoribosyltransferase [Anaerovirgula multivorans]|uniref:Nicotinate-nucleotide--dimethylbenzimidazole phosphoribosyltransferase n=1 Tax=Anaerovirgula multivorans TaxID=312168 RepID=A0A238ZVR8_9FIRM|nr:nicotinate-nucleotide--dimethylbenzimidazole phosphoribosyltransferase [Anaerovirgula multivorans]SNR87455.1 nicotinate-nucleotide-dimethylbenzimidazole phosphoribosyltransferase [Anaerovirgula multivorans]